MNMAFGITEEDVQNVVTQHGHTFCDSDIALAFKSLESSPH